jgi:hypothetical protein
LCYENNPGITGIYRPPTRTDLYCATVQSTFQGVHAYARRTGQTAKQIMVRFPISPYPNTVASSKLKIVGFGNPMSYCALLAPRFMSHLAHNPSNTWGDWRNPFAILKMTGSSRRGIAVRWRWCRPRPEKSRDFEIRKMASSARCGITTVEEHHQKTGRSNRPKPLV